MKKISLFGTFLFLRIASVFLVQTSFVPDEYWQSLEVAHNFIFGYGYKTWEWEYGVRSFAYPGIFSILYKFLEICGIDTIFNVVFLPRILQAILTAFADYHFVLWVKEQQKTEGKWATFMLITSWFYFYCGSRTLINTFETNITIFALRSYPWGDKMINEIKTCYLWQAVILCLIRPTASIIWSPLILYNLIKSTNKKKFILALLRISFISVAFIALIDYLYYGKFVSTTWNFLYFNIMEDVGSHYGENPIYFYFTCGLPVILGLHIIPFIYGAKRAVQTKHHVQLLLFFVILWTIIIYSFIPHKEFRFLLPILPMCLYIASAGLADWSRKAKSSYVWIVATTLLIASIVPTIYFGMFHQKGTLSVINNLSDIALNDPQGTNILFLTPCHATPYYSHIHTNIPMRFLTCEPNFKKTENYKDEADIFFSNPADWLKKEYKNSSVLPSHIIIYDNIQTDVKNYLANHMYNFVGKFSQCEGLFCLKNIGEYVLIYSRNK